MFEQVLSIDRMENAVSLFGSFDENIRLIESEFSVTDMSYLLLRTAKRTSLCPYRAIASA